MPDHNQPCYMCNKPTRSVPIGRKMFCKVCWDTITLKDQEDMKRIAAQEAAHDAAMFAEMIAHARAARKKFRPVILSDRVTVVESNVPVSMERPEEEK